MACVHRDRPHGHPHPVRGRRNRSCTRPVYALAVRSAFGVRLQQAALHVGPLRISQPFLVIIDPLVSIALSVWLFDERFIPNAAILAVAAIAFAVMCAGVVLLTQTAPPTMAADTGT